MNSAIRLVIVLLSLLAGRAAAVEEPPYTVVTEFDEFEVRQYPPYIVAETLVNGPAEDASYSAFSRLAGYIFGENEGGNSIAMTAPVAQMPVRLDAQQPVTQQSADGRYLVQFAMPAEFTLQTLPKPNDPRVNLRELPSRKIAALRYSGRWTDSQYQSHLQKLQQALSRQGLEWQGEPVWARYDSPWMPAFMRRNEILLQLK